MIIILRIQVPLARLRQMSQYRKATLSKCVVHLEVMNRNSSSDTEGICLLKDRGCDYPGNGFNSVIIQFVLFASSSKGRCNYPETDYTPCVTRTRANLLFHHCCQLYVPEGCHDLCQYETEEIAARNLLMKAITSKKCGLKYISAILYCASQNQDNRKCCAHLNLADKKLGVGDRCLRFCDPAGQGINVISNNDATCLFNWNVILYCHQSGIPLE